MNHHRFDRFGKFFLGAALLFHPLTAQAEAPAAAPPLPDPKLPIAMNLAGITDYNPGFPFKNLMWGARPWLTKNADGTGAFNTDFAAKIPLTPQGYPLELPFVPEGASQPQTVFTIIPNTTEPGEYVLLYDGQGVIEAAMGTTVTLSESGRLILTLKNLPTDGAYEGIAIKQSTKGNPVRNIRILRKEDEKADLKANPFREDFLKYSKQWHALRFMDWMSTNNSLDKEWADRKKPDFYTMVGTGGDATGRWGSAPSAFNRLFSGGVPLELMIQLANITKTSPWFNIPHRATPEYMTEFAKMVKAKLDPSLKVYFEYSNEVWNWQFHQATWMIQSKVAAEGLEATTAWKDGIVPTQFPLDDGTVAKDGGSGHPERMGVLNRRLFNQLEKIYTGKDRERMVRVIGVQHGWPDTAKRTVNYVMKHGGADAVSPAGYFGPNTAIYERWAAAGANLTAEQVIADMNEAFDKDSTTWTRAIAEIANQHKLQYIVYEGGQHIQPKGQEVTPYMPALKAAQTHPGMYDVYLRNLALHQEVGCDLFAAFSSISKQGGRYGSWGHSESYSQPLSEAPKLRALVKANTPK